MNAQYRHKNHSDTHHTLSITPSKTSINFIWLSVFIGGGIGALLRVGIVMAIHTITLSMFPSQQHYLTEESSMLALLIINILGCVGMGMLTVLATYEYKWVKNPHIFIGLQTGLLGSFTTFASIAMLIWSFLQPVVHANHPFSLYILLTYMGIVAFIVTGYFILSVILGIIGYILGMKIAQRLPKNIF